MMNRLLLLFFYIIFSNCCLSQIDHIFYVNDVENVEYLTVNFCIDNEGKTSSVNILPDKTTYKNENIINQVIEYRKGIEYYPDSNLNNNCYDYTFTFLNIKYQTETLDSSELEKCANFKNGVFKYNNTIHPNTIIERTEEFQIEKTGKDFIKFKIDWLTPNKYTLTYFEVSDKEYEYLLGEKIEVEIIKIINGNEYLYFSNLLDRTYTSMIITKTN